MVFPLERLVLAVRSMWSRKGASRNAQGPTRTRRLLGQQLEDRALLAGSVSITQALATEGNGPGDTMMTVVATYSGDLTPFTVDYETYDTSAIGGTDYDSSSGTLSFSGLDGEQRTFVIHVKGDSVVELDEAFGIRLLNVNTVGVDAVSPAMAGIYNDDSATIEIILAPALPPTYPAEDGTHNESESGTPVRYLIKMIGEVDVPVEVDWEIFHNQTEVEDFFGARSGTVSLNTIPNPDHIVFVFPTNDNKVEGDESFAFTLPIGGRKGGNSALSLPMQPSPARLSATISSPWMFWTSLERREQVRPIGPTSF